MITLNHCTAVPLHCPIPPETNHAQLADGFWDRLQNEYISKFNSKSAVWNVTAACAHIINARIKPDTTRTFESSSINTHTHTLSGISCLQNFRFLESFHTFGREFPKGVVRKQTLWPRRAKGRADSPRGFIGCGDVLWFVTVGNIMKRRSFWFKSSNKHFISAQG